MKNLSILFASFIILGMLSGCKKDDSSSTSSKGFSVKIDGATWSPSVFTAFHDPASNITEISATDLSKSMFIEFVGSTTGTYLLSGDPNNMCSFTDASAQNAWMATGTNQPSAAIVITEYNTSAKTISGTFSFVGYDLDDLQKSFTEGKFTKIPYTEQ